MVENLNKSVQQNLLASNPLFIPQVLSNVFKNMSRPDLLNARLVNKEWSKEASVIFSAQKTLLFQTDEDFKKYSEITSDSQFTFHKFKFAFEGNDHGSCVDIKNHITDFLQKDGKNVQYLHLNIGENLGHLYFPLETFRQFVFFKCPSISTLVIEKIPHEIATSPNLLACTESLLKLTKFVLYLQPSYADMRFLLHLFVSFPKTLKELQIFADEPAIVLQIQKKALRMLCNLQNANRCAFCHLGKLTLDFPLDDSDLNCLGQLNLKLESFIGRINFSCGNDPISNFLQGQLNTLKTLDLEMIFPEKSTLDLFSFPQGLESICDLRLNLTFIGQHCLKLGEITRKFTNLEKLKLEIHHLATVQLEMDQGLEFQNRNIKSLVFCKGVEVLNENQMKNICTAFPNLEKLQICTDDNNLRIIFGNLQKLEQLIIFGSMGLSDESLTGINFQTLKGIEKNLIKLNSTEVPKIEQEQYRKNIPFIGNLKNLKTLSIFESSRSKLTDFSVLFGICHLEQLNTLNLDFGLAEPWNNNITSYLSDRSIESIERELPSLTNFGLDSKLVSRNAITNLSKNKPHLKLQHLARIRDFDTGELHLTSSAIKIPEIICEECGKEAGKHCFVSPFLPKRSIIEITKRNSQMYISSKRRWWRKKRVLISFACVMIIFFLLLVLLMTFS